MIGMKTLSVSIAVLTLLGMSGNAIAGSYPYAVLRGDMDDFVVQGSNPTLSPSAGVGAYIDHIDDLGNGFKRVWVVCPESSPSNCAGTIETQ